MGTLTPTGKTTILTSGLPATTYAAFVTSDPSAFTSMADVVAAEVTFSGYARPAISWGTPAAGSVANDADFVTPSLTDADGVTAIAGVCVVTSASGSGGSNIAVTTVSGADLTPAANEAVRVAAGALTIDL